MLSMNLLWYATFAAKAFSQSHGEEAAKEMGPAAFLWPPDREWGASVDNTAPCGSSASVGNRTDFPLNNGQVALVMQDEAYRVTVSIAYSNGPTSNEDFESVIDARYIPDVDPGHQCYPIPTLPERAQSNSNATLQIKYTADFDDEGKETGNNETFYACADIKFVPVEAFSFQVPCFNASSEEFSLPENGTDSPSSSSAGQASSTANSDSSIGVETSSDGISGGAIAGAVVGSVIGLALIAGAGFLIWRLRQQRERLREQQASVRAVKWNEAERDPSNDGTAVPLENLPASRG